MSEIEYKVVADHFKQCSIYVPPYFRARCNDHAVYAVQVFDGSWLWRCEAHKDALNLRTDGATLERGNYSRLFPSKVES